MSRIETKSLISEFAVEGLDCPEEAKLIENTLRGWQGIESIAPNFLQGSVKVTHHADITSAEISEKIRSAGLKVLSAKEVESHGGNLEQNLSKRFNLVLGSASCLGFGLLCAHYKISDRLDVAFFIVSILIGGSLVVPKALRSLKSLTLNMNVLMLIAVLGAAAINDWAEAAAVTFLFSLSEYLESFSVSRARRAVDSLMKLTPKVAFVKVNGLFIEKPLVEVVVDDFVQVRAGARIPVDGIIKNGTSLVNQAPITGESMPISKLPGDLVFAGSINGEGTLQIGVTKLASESTIAGIVRLVTDAQGQKAPAQRFVDRFAAIYTPVVLVLAVATFLIVPVFFGGAWDTWLYRALVLLVIACPCALVISTPVTIVSGLTAMARRGVIIKGGTSLEALGKIRALAVDKTGTITEGRPEVTGILPLHSVSAEEIIRIAASLDASSNHPLAQAIVRYAREKKISFPESTELQAITGMGVRGIIDGHLYFLGNHHFAEELKVCSKKLEALLAEIEYSAQSVVIVGHALHGENDEVVFGVISVADQVRKEAKTAIAAIHKSGVEKIVMLSGDNVRTAQTIASQVGIDDARGNLLPSDKILAIQDLVKTHVNVAMIGDGVNDAPAMAASSVGIAMGGVGTDTAIETADVTLMQDDLGKVAEAIVMGKRVMGIIRFNITFSLMIKFVFLALAIGGFSSLWLAIFADTGATVLVIMNALRLLRVPKF